MGIASVAVSQDSSNAIRRPEGDVLVNSRKLRVLPLLRGPIANYRDSK